LGQKITLLFRYEDYNDYNLLIEKCSATMSGLLLLLLQVHHSILSSHNQLISWEKRKGCIRRKSWRGMLRSNLRKVCKTWARKGMGFWNSLLVLFLVLSNDTLRPLFIWEKYGYSVLGRDTRGKMVSKPLIARKLRRIPYNFWRQTRAN